MRVKLGGRLSVPRMLAATAIVSMPACGDDGKKTSETEAATSTGASSGDDTGATTGATTAGPTTADPTGTTGVTTTATDTGSDSTGGLPDCQNLGNETSCNAEPGCLWYPEFPACFTDCQAIKDEVTCEMTNECQWFGSTCELAIA